MGKKKNREGMSAFYMECERWLEKNRQSLETAIHQRLQDRIGPIGQRSDSGVYCSEASFSLSVYDIHNPLVQAQVTYTMCDETTCYTLHKTARAGLASPLDTASIQKRLCKSLSKQLSAAVGAVAAGKITEEFLAAELEPSEETSGLEDANPPSAKDIQDTFCNIKTSAPFMRNMEKYLLDIFSGYGLRESSLDVHASAEPCGDGVRFAAEVAVFFPHMKIPLPKMDKIVSIDPEYLAWQTKEECLDLFDRRARIGLGELLREQLDVFAVRQLFYMDCWDASPIDPDYYIKILMGQIRNTITPYPDDMVQVHWKGMNYDLSQSALFIGDDGKVRIYVDEISRPVYVGTISSDSDYDRPVPDSETLFEATESIVAAFQGQPMDMEVIIELDPLTIRPVRVKIGFAEYYPDQSHWFLPEEIRNTKELVDKLCSETAAQKMTQSRTTNDEMLTNVELALLEIMQKNPHRGKAFILEAVKRAEVSKPGRKLLFEGKLQKFFIWEKGETYYLRPQYANIPYEKLFPAAPDFEYSEFFKWDDMRRGFERQLRLAQSPEEFAAAFRTLKLSGVRFQESFLRTEEGMQFLKNLSGETARDARELLMELPGGEILIDLLPHNGEQAGDD